LGARFNVVVKALCYKPEGRGFYTRLGDFFKVTKSFRLHYSLGFTQPLAEMSTRSRKRMFLGSKVRPMSRADNLTTICEPIV
jgi:hypothetical protein